MDTVHNPRVSLFRYSMMAQFILDFCPRIHGSYCDMTIRTLQRISERSESTCGYQGAELAAGRWVRSQRAFTLMELLVVIGIIAILAALLFIAVTSAARRSRSIVCLGNLHQQSISLSGFVLQYGAYPAEGLFEADGFAGQKGHWMKTLFSEDSAAISPVLGQKMFRGTLYCPSAPKNLDFLPKDSGFACYGFNSRGISRTSLTTNGFGLGVEVVDGVSRPVPSDHVVSPANMYALGDGVSGNGENLTDGTLLLARAVDIPFKSDAFSRIQERHSGKLNVLSCDGHASSIAIGFLFTDSSEAALSHWNRDYRSHREMLR